MTKETLITESSGIKACKEPCIFASNRIYSRRRRSLFSVGKAGQHDESISLKRCCQMEINSFLYRALLFLTFVVNSCEVKCYTEII